MQLRSFSRLALLCTVALASCVLAAPSSSSDAAAKLSSETSAVEDVIALAASLSIDLSKAPAWRAIPALNLTPITPSEGLPTLEGLSLTWSDLLKPVDPSEFYEDDSSALQSRADRLSTLTKRFNPRCYGQDPLRYREALFCHNYLWNLGTTMCHVPTGGGREQRFCIGGDVIWTGKSTNSSPQASYCRDVAKGGAWVLETCTVIGAPDLWITDGANAAWGNGNLVVSVLEA